MSQSKIGVVYLTDGNRDDLTYASVVALAIHHDRELDIHIVQVGFKARPPKSVLDAVQDRGHRLATHHLPVADTGLQGRGHITATAYAKVDAVKAASEGHDIVLYLDNDTLAVRELDLAGAAPRSQPLAACPDLSVSTGLDNADFFSNCDKHGLETRYFNSGLLAINVPRWKDSGIPERYETSVRSHADFCPYWDGRCRDLDQCALNIASQGCWEALPIEFNVQKSAFQTEYWDQARIRHYTGSQKFLPVKPHRLDDLERSVLARVGHAVPELRIRKPSAILKIAYVANRYRRQAARTHTSRLIELHLAT
jgi:lipopolysaccharide biosynthesis glycosyltransferase